MWWQGVLLLAVFQLGPVLHVEKYPSFRSGQNFFTELLKSIKLSIKNECKNKKQILCNGIAQGGPLLASFSNMYYSGCASNFFRYCTFPKIIQRFPFSSLCRGFLFDE